MYSSFHTVRIVLYMGCTGPVIGSLTAYILIILRPSATGTLPLSTQILRTVTKWRATTQIIDRNVQNFLFPHLFGFFTMYCP